MTAVYPGSLPVKEAAGAQLSTNPHSQLHDDMYDEIVAIATELGINASGPAATVAARIEALEPDWESYAIAAASQGGSVSLSVSHSSYEVINKRVTWNFRLQMTAAGTANNAFQLALPVVAVSSSSIVGVGSILQTTHATGIWAGFSTAAVGFRVDGQTGWWGQTPNVAIANGATLYGSITYPTV